jgi:hypothetical protein
MRPTVVAKDKTVFIAFVLPKALKEVKDAGLTPPTERNARDLINSVGGSSDFKSTFRKQPTKISAVRIPRSALSKSVLQQIDGCMYFILLIVSCIVSMLLLMNQSIQPG